MSSANPGAQVARVGWVGALLLVVSGAVQALISPPLNWWALHPFALAPGLYVLMRLRGRRAFFGGLLMGTCANVSIFYWIVHTVQTFSNFPTAGAVGVLLLFSVAFGGYVAVFGVLAGSVRRVAGNHWPLAVATLFVACEFLNPQLFPYYQGVAWYQLPRVFLVTAVTGVPGVTFQVVLVNLLLVALAESRIRSGAFRFPRELRGSMAVSAAMLLFSLVVSHVRLGDIDAAEANAEEITIGLVQTNNDVHTRVKLLRRSRDAVAVAHAGLAHEAFEKNPNIDVFVFPEGALRRPPTWPENDVVLDLAKETGTEVWTGATDVRGNPGEVMQAYNAAWRVHSGTVTDPPYDKTILLPFGEFMPMAETFPILKKIQGVGNFKPGTGMKTFQGGDGTKFCFLICYEAIRHEYVREGIRQGVQLLVNITYDAWFGDTSCLTQHLMLSVIQSAEYGVPLVRAATTGISAVADARGMIVAQTEPFTRDVLVADVKKVSVPSFYGKWGDWFAWLCVSCSAGLLGEAIRRRWMQRQAASTPPPSYPG